MGFSPTTLLTFVSGEPESGSLEHRLFSCIALLNSVANLGGGVVMLLQQAQWLAGLHIVTGLVFAVFYYVSRFRNTYRVLYWPFVLVMLGFLFVNSIGNSGTLGGAHYYLIPAVVIAVILNRDRRTTAATLLLFSTAAVTLVFMEGLHPGLFASHETEAVRLWDVGLNLVFVQLLTAGLVLVLSGSFDVEREKAERLSSNVSSLTESAADAIIGADRHSRIQSWNRAAERMFGYSPEQAMGMSLTAIIPQRYRDAHDQGIERMASTGEARVIGSTVELTALRKNGDEFPVELSLSHWSVKNQNFFSGIIRDISRRKEGENALLQTQSDLENKARELELAHGELQSKNQQLEGLASKLAKYLSSQVYRSIFEGDKDVKVESYRKKLTIFFSDIKGFTDLTDGMEPEDLSSLLNNYLDEMSRIANRHGGTIDKFIGDAIMVFFGDPKSNGEREDALACVKMALEMRARMPELRKRWEQEWGLSQSLRIRMGINTGFCTVGNFGSEERLDYTIVGGQVNLASRLESAAETDQILISDDCHGLIKHAVACAPRGELTVKGIARPVETYQVLDLHENRSIDSQPIREEFEGFSLEVDLNSLDQRGRVDALKHLEEAIRKVRGE